MTNDKRPFLLLALLSAFPPLSTDMYLPAIPLLLVGIGIFILASLLCAISDNVVSLIVFRVFQAAGAASLLIFIYFMLGAFSMWLIALDWTDKIRTIGVLGTVSGGIILGIWLFLPKIVAAKRAAWTVI